MNVIKLDAIDSTNDFLKDLSKKQVVENFTTVVANYQTGGKGQMGAIWDSEMGKNLITSILIKDCLTEIQEIFHLNVAVSLAITSVLQRLNIPKLSIKWPNDIMSDTKKMAGILIENSFKTDNRIESVVGIGLNVNQLNFSNLPKATSLSAVMNQEYDLEALLDDIVFQIKKNCALIVSKQTDFLWQNYHENLFKMGMPMAFEDASKNQFMGIIQRVTEEGLLQLILEDDSIKAFGVKELQMLY